jgi:Fe/S biogenesis protein NfuA
MDQIITISDEAIAAILDIRSREPDAGELALTLSVTGVQGLEYAYDLTFTPLPDAGADDVVHHHGDLPVIIPGASIEHLQGATLNVADGGLAIDNPNSPIPKIEPGSAMATGPVADRVAAVLSQQINPAIAAHGGWAELVGVEGDTVFLRLGGGCQGCGLAAVTLRQGIERAIKAAIPEVANVVDATDHASGANPYYTAEGHSHSH